MNRKDHSKRVCRVTWRKSREFAAISAFPMDSSLIEQSEVSYSRSACDVATEPTANPV